MKHTFSKKNIVIMAVLCALVMSIGAVTVYAYFSSRAYVYTNDGNTEYARVGMHLNLLFDMLDNSAGNLPVNASGKPISGIARSTTYGPDGKEIIEYYEYSDIAEWGSPENPYIISDIRHMHNLSVLQEIGYFDENYIQYNYTDGITYNNLASMPYFLVCNPDGTPVTINGTGTTFSPIGSDEYPFIGYFGGAFNNVDSEGKPITTIAKNEDGSDVEGALPADTSTIYNLTIKTDTDNVDVGLFGVIGFLGEEQAVTKENPTGAFYGANSSVSDLLLYDVKIVVDKPTVAGKLADFIEALGKHRFSNAKDSSAPAENHHIGILAGHVEYADVHRISVYYSDKSDNAAISLEHIFAKDADGASGDVIPNYMSTTGIIGFLYHMNPNSNEGTVSAGSGISTEDISIDSAGGSGGGELSGVGRGYITAEYIYERFSYAGNRDDKGQIIWEYYVKGDSKTQYTGIFIVKNDFGLFLQDGTTPVTINGKTASAEGNNWDNYIIRDITSTPEICVDQDGREIEHYEETGLVLKNGLSNNGNPLSTEYVVTRLFGLITNRTNRYYFYDGVFTFALSKTYSNENEDIKDDLIVDTWKNDKPDTFAVGANDPDEWETNISEGNAAVVAYLKQVTDEDEFTAAIQGGKKFIVLNKYGNDEVPFAISLSTVGNSGSANNDNRYSSPAKSLQFIDEVTATSLYNGYSRGDIKTMPADMGGDISNLLDNWSDYQLVYFGQGSASDKEKLDELKADYLVDMTQSSTKDIFAFDDTIQSEVVSTVTVDRAAGVATEIRTEERSYPGYFLCTISDTKSAFLIGTTEHTYTYQYVTFNASADSSETPVENRVDIGSPQQDTRGTLRGFSYITGNKSILTNVFRNAQYSEPNLESDGELRMYTSGQYSGPLFFVKSGSQEYYTTDKDCLNGTEQNKVDNQAGLVITNINKKYTYSNFILQENDAEKSRFIYPGGQKIQTITDSGETGINNHSLYRHEGGGEATIKIDVKSNYSCILRHETGTSSGLSADDQVMRILEFTTTERYLLFFTRNVTHYSIWSGMDSQVPNGITAQANIGNIVFNDDGTCNIRYELNNNNRYVSFNYVSSENSRFVSSNSTDGNNSRLILYTYEGSQTASYGRVTFDPREGSLAGEYNSDEYLLWPNEVVSGGNTVNNPTYKIVKLGEGNLTQARGWKNRSGVQLSRSDLYRKFKMSQAINFGFNFGILNDNIDYNTIEAPVGTLGVKTNIPLGCVAFRVNKPGDSIIRVIVAVPQTEGYKGEADYTFGTEQPYFGLWQIEEASNGLVSFRSFQKSDALLKFALPFSNKYKPASTAGGVDSNYIIIQNRDEGSTDTKQYRCYLNGDRVLVAYEFTVSQAGVYVLGNTVGPMEVVYFSADGTASADRDGSSGSLIGDIDFVYDHGGRVITVKDSGAANEFDNYYASLCLMYTDNATKVNGSFVDINDFRINVRRVIQEKNGEEESYLTMSVSSPLISTENKIVNLQPYSMAADKTATSYDSSQ